LKTVAIIQARMTSTRLPGKVMLPLLGKPILVRLLERIEAAPQIDEIVVATTTNATDDVLVDLCASLGVASYRGSEQDVLSRYHGAANQYGAQTVIRLTSDCPLLDIAIISDVINAYQEHVIGTKKPDYASNMIEPTYPYGMAVEVFSVEALNDAHMESIDPVEREHVTPFIYRRPERYALASVKLAADFSSYRCTVDTPEDYDLVSRMFERLYPQNPAFTTADMIALLDQNPAWRDINSHVKQVKV
jgi:spore coat polysaccharide biosynthesis protein SpsF